MSGIGAPQKILTEAIGMTVSVELQTGQLYRGKLVYVEDNMNLQLRDVTVTARDGQVSAAEQVFIRGSQVRLFVLPDNLRHSPVFKQFGKRERSRGGSSKTKATPKRKFSFSQRVCNQECHIQMLKSLLKSSPDTKFMIRSQVQRSL